MTTEARGCEHWQSRLDDFVDDLLPARESQELQSHLQDCASCRHEVDEIRGLLAAVHDLPSAMTPPESSWSEIESRLTPRASRPRLHGWIPQAIAAALLVAFGGISSRILWPPTSPEALLAENGIASETASEDASEGTMSGAVALARAEADYLRVKESLWISIYHHRNELSPMTVSVVEHNLRTIDKAIEEIHTALEQDPGNPQLESQLFANHRRGIGLLRRLATTANET